MADNRKGKEKALEYKEPTDSSSAPDPVLDDEDDDDDDYLKPPEVIDHAYGFDFGPDHNEFLEDIYVTMSTGQHLRILLSEQGLERFGGGAGALFAPPISQLLPVAAASFYPPKPKPHDLKQKGIGTAPDVEPHHPYSGLRTWLRPRPDEGGEASWAVCVICGEDRPSGQIKRPFKCKHLVCDDCLGPYIGRMIQETIHQVKCPHKTCDNTLTEEQARCYVPRHVADRWFEASREARVLGSPTCFQCPFEDCSSWIVDDQRGFLIRACTKCWKIFCMSCRVPWHTGLKCSEFRAKMFRLSRKKSRRTRIAFGELFGR